MSSAASSHDSELTQALAALREPLRAALAACAPDSAARPTLLPALPQAQTPDAAEALTAFASAEAVRLRQEILAVGRKLWQRQYIDGNGGNISARIGRRWLLATPTLMSKGDLTEADLSLLDLDGCRLAGDRPVTSEILLHLTLYRANPQIAAVVHCHAPSATAWALTGEAPPTGYLPEYELMAAPTPLAPYRTPGTQAFADTVLPFACDHNTALLANHGLVCWADSPTRAYSLTEIVDGYCRVLAQARLSGRPLTRIPEAQMAELLEQKRRLGFPDPRLAPSAASAKTAAAPQPTPAAASTVLEKEEKKLAADLSTATLLSELLTRLG